jgi:hypothetical protein
MLQPAREQSSRINIVLNLQFIPEDGGNIFLRNLGKFIWNYSVLQHAREQSSLINIILDLQFIPEDWGNIFLRNLGKFI